MLTILPADELMMMMMIDDESKQFYIYEPVACPKKFSKGMFNSRLEWEENNY
jgi:hypothetical protein